LHTSISTHICAEYYDKTTKTWVTNLDCFIERVGKFPDRIQNLYFTFIFMIRAVAKLTPYLKKYTFCDGTNDWELAKNLVEKVTETLTFCPLTFNEKQLFQQPNQALKLEFRDKFRNISNIMDCVSCEKCRLWGKLQTMGLGTALKILFSYDDK
jgi:hypothetical protein